MDDLPHIGRLCRTPYLAMMEKVYAKLAQEGYTDLNATFSIVFQTIGDGARLTQMAKMANQSKQYMKHLVVKMQELEYVEKSKEGLDGRAVIYKLSPKGVVWRDKAYKIIAEVEAEWADAIGIDNMKQLKVLLHNLGKVVHTRP